MGKPNERLNDLKTRAERLRAFINECVAEIAQRRADGRFTREQAIEAGKPIFDYVREVNRLEEQLREAK